MREGFLFFVGGRETACFLSLHPNSKITTSKMTTTLKQSTGNIIGRTQTLTLYVESAYKEYCTEAAFAAAVILAALALVTLWVKDRVEAAAAAEATAK